MNSAKGMARDRHDGGRKMSSRSGPWSKRLPRRIGRIVAHDRTQMFEPLENRRLLAATPGAVVVSDDFSAGAGNFTVIDGSWGVVDGAYLATTAGTAGTTHLNTRTINTTSIPDGDFTLTTDASVAGT